MKKKNLSKSFVPVIRIFGFRAMAYRMVRSRLTWVFILVLSTNLYTYWSFRPEISSEKKATPVSGEPSLYLLDKAAAFIPDTALFKDQIMEIALSIEVPAEWLMAVIYQESKFDASALNRAGSGAAGLIQFLPSTAASLNLPYEEILAMSAYEQMRFVGKYLQQVRHQRGDFQSLTDLYLAILYPKALQQDYCYALFVTPSIAYKRNKGLDENEDGVVSISDIDRRMRRMFPPAYMLAANR